MRKKKKKKEKTKRRLDGRGEMEREQKRYRKEKKIKVVANVYSLQYQPGFFSFVFCLFCSHRLVASFSIDRCGWLAWVSDGICSILHKKKNQLTMRPFGLNHGVWHGMAWH